MGDSPSCSHRNGGFSLHVHIAMGDSPPCIILGVAATKNKSAKRATTQTVPLEIAGMPVLKKFCFLGSRFMDSCLSKVTVLKCVFMDSSFFFGLRWFCQLAPRSAS